MQQPPPPGPYGYGPPPGAYPYPYPGMPGAPAQLPPGSQPPPVAPPPGMPGYPMYPGYPPIGGYPGYPPMPGGGYILAPGTPYPAQFARPPPMVTPPRPVVPTVPTVPTSGTPTLPGPLAAAALAKMATVAAPPKPADESATVYVGKINPDVSNEYVQSLLEVCGEVLKWDRVSDPDSGAMKGFGFCKYSSPAGVLRAVKLLNGFKIDDKELLVKVDAKTQALIDAWVVRTKEEMARKEIEAKQAELQGFAKKVKEDLKEEADDKDNAEAGEKGDAATDENSEAEKSDAKPKDEQKPDDAEGDQAEATGPKLIPPPPPPKGAPPPGLEKLDTEEESAKLAEKLATMEVERVRNIPPDVRRRMEREKERKEREERRERAKQLDSLVDTAKDDNKAAQPSDADKRDDRSERDRDRKDRDRDRDSARTRERDEEKEREKKYQQKEKEWERREREREREYGSSRRSDRSDRDRDRSDRDRDRDRGRERDRYTRKDRDDDEGRHKKSREAADEPEEGEIADGDADAPQAPPPPPPPPPQQRSPEPERAKVPAVFEAMMKDKEAADKAAREAEGGLFVEQPKMEFKPLAPMKLQMKTSGAATKRKATNAFGEDEEEKVKISLRKIEYSEEEKRALEDAKMQAVGYETKTRDGVTVRLTGKAAAQAAREDEQRKKVDEQKAIAKMIPIDKDALFSFKVDWLLVDSERIVESRMRPWVSKKITEFLGEEEKSLVDFIVGKIASHDDATEFVKELGDVLDNEAEMFVMKMWRLLIFEALQAGVKSGSVKLEIPKK